MDARTIPGYLSLIALKLHPLLSPLRNSSSADLKLRHNCCPSKDNKTLKISNFQFIEILFNIDLTGSKFPAVGNINTPNQGVIQVS